MKAIKATGTKVKQLAAGLMALEHDFIYRDGALIVTATHDPEKFSNYIAKRLGLTEGLNIEVIEFEFDF